MPDVNLPLSGAVAQALKTWFSLFSPSGSQIGLFNVNLGKSSNPVVEEEVLLDVASYGRQLGRIADYLTVLLRHVGPEDAKLTPEEQKAVRALKRMLDGIADVKERHSTKPALRPR